MAESSRRGSVHNVQGFCVSMLPQIRHTEIFSMAVCKAAANGAINSSRFFIRNNAARRAERGPRPGNRASNAIRRSISGPAEMAGIKQLSKQFQARRQRQPAGQRLHFFLEHGLELAARVGMRRSDEILENFLLIGLEKR